MCTIAFSASRTIWWPWSIRRCCPASFTFPSSEKSTREVYTCSRLHGEHFICVSLLLYFYSRIFFTHGLKLNYELLLFCKQLLKWSPTSPIHVHVSPLSHTGGPGAPFRNSFYLHEDYKSASKKYALLEYTNTLHTCTCMWMYTCGIIHIVAISSYVMCISLLSVGMS